MWGGVEKTSQMSEITGMDLYDSMQESLLNILLFEFWKCLN